MVEAVGALEKPRCFVITRSNWLRGGEDSELRNTGGMMCCLGFYAKACGLSNEQIDGVPTPASCPIALPEMVTDDWSGDRLGACDSEVARILMDLNDVEANVESSCGEAFVKDEADRERQIAEQFGIIGVQVTFVD